MHDIVFCLLVAAARHTLTSPNVPSQGYVPGRVRPMLDFLYHPAMQGNADMYYMYSGDALGVPKTR